MDYPGRFDEKNNKFILEHNQGELHYQKWWPAVSKLTGVEISYSLNGKQRRTRCEKAKIVKMPYPLNNIPRETEYLILLELSQFQRTILFDKNKKIIGEKDTLFEFLRHRI